MYHRASIRQSRVAELVVEQRRAVLPELWWQCMPEPLSPKSGFGMNVTVRPFGPRGVLDDVLVVHQVVGRVSSVSKL